MRQNQLEYLSIIFLTHYYCFLWKFPFAWDFERNKVVSNPVSVSVKCCLGAIIGSYTMFGLNTFAYHYFLPNYPFGRLEFVINILCWDTVASVFLAYVTVYTWRNQIGDWFNAGHELEIRFRAGRINLKTF